MILKYENSNPQKFILICVVFKFANSKSSSHKFKLSKLSSIKLLFNSNEPRTKIDKSNSDLKLLSSEKYYYF